MNAIAYKANLWMLQNFLIGKIRLRAMWTN